MDPYRAGADYPNVSLATIAVLACLSGFAAEQHEAPDADPATHNLSVEVAPLLFAFWPAFHEDGYSDRFNVSPEASLTSLGLGLSYGHRFSRRFELAGGVEYLRMPPFADDVAQQIRVTTTPFAVFGRGRPYDISLGPRLGFSALSLADEWVPQFTALLVVRQRVWVHENVGLQLAVSSGVHPTLGPGPEKLDLTISFEFIAMHVGVAARF